MDPLALTGRVAIITGAGRGIGKVIAKVLAEAGADVVCTARTKEQIEATAAEIKSLGRDALAITCDVTIGEQVENMVNLTKKEFRGVDILVNNAGGGHYAGALKLSENDWESALRQNLISCFLCSKAVAKGMIEQQEGCIINISSGASLLGSPGFSAYGAAKAGVNHLTRTLAYEFAPFVRVNAITVGLTQTELSAAYIDSKRDELVQGILLKRTGRPEDIAQAVLFLASPASSWVTGQILGVDGGIVHVRT